MTTAGQITRSVFTWAALLSSICQEVIIAKQIKVVLCLDLTVFMVDSITFGQEMVNILVSGEAYDKVFNRLDMLHAPLKGKEMDIIKKAENQAKMTKLSMEWKRLCKSGQSPKMPKPEPETENYYWMHLYHLMVRDNAQCINCETKWALNQLSTAHLCAIDKDCEDFEGPILAQLQPISAIVHTKPTS
ncbi:hypothetical protein Tco_0718010 [Tanacetum coccineum]